jgi:predicted transcriptional regulator
MKNLEKNKFQQQLIDKLNHGEISLGQAVQHIRTGLYQMTQANYARLCKVSEKTLREVEKGNTDPRLSIVENLLRPGGFSLSARLKVNQVKSMSELVDNNLL